MFFLFFTTHKRTNEHRHFLSCSSQLKINPDWNIKPVFPKLQSYIWFCEHVQNFTPSQAKPTSSLSYKATWNLDCMTSLSIQTNLGLPKLQSYIRFCEDGQISTSIEVYFKPELQSYIKLREQDFDFNHLILWAWSFQPIHAYFKPNL